MCGQGWADIGGSRFRDKRTLSGVFAKALGVRFFLVLNAAAVLSVLQ